MNTLRTSIVVLCLSLLTFSCIKKEKYDKVELEPWEPSMAVPLIKGDLSLKDAAENIDEDEVNVEERENGLYVLVYNDTLKSDYAENLITIPDQHFEESHSISPPLSFTLTPGLQFEENYSGTWEFETENNQKLNYVDLKGGILNFEFSTTLRHNVDLTVTLPTLEKNGVPFSETFNLQYQGSSPISVSKTINLTGYRVNFSDINSPSSNSFEYQLEAKVVSTGEPTNPTESISVEVGLQDLRYKVIYGSIGDYPFPPYEGTVNVEVFDNAEQGEIVFNDPTLRLKLDNTFGVSSQFLINKLETKTDYGVITQISSSGDLEIPGPNIINAPQVPGNVAQTTFELSKQNSNIVEAFKTAPSQINYKVTPSIQTQNLDTPSFIMDTSRVTAYLEAEIPLDGSIKIFSLTDTIQNIEFPDEDYVKSATLKIKTINGLPLDVSFQGYWLDENERIIDTLIVPEKDLLVSGQVNTNGEVIEPVEQYLEIKYDENKYQNVKRAKSLIIKGDLTSTDNGQTMVKFFSHNNLQIQISVLVNAKVEF